MKSENVTSNNLLIILLIARSYIISSPTRIYCICLSYPRKIVRVPLYIRVYTTIIQFVCIGNRFMNFRKISVVPNT